MLTMNRVTVLGHAGRNPEIRSLPSGDEVALFSLATNERFRRRDGTEGESTEWHAIVAFGNAARTVRKLVHRGAAVLVEGRIATRTWTDRAGTEHRTSEILVSGPQARVNVLTRRGREAGGDEPPRGSAPPGAAKAADADRGDDSADPVAAPASDVAGDTDAGSSAVGSSADRPSGGDIVQTDEAGVATDEQASAGTEGGTEGDTTDCVDADADSSADGPSRDAGSDKSVGASAKNGVAAASTEAGTAGRTDDADHD